MFIRQPYVTKIIQGDQNPHDLSDSSIFHKHATGCNNIVLLK